MSSKTKFRIHEAPMLENFFANITCNGAVNYCALCLRTQQERRLVSNKTLKEFSNAMKMEKDWKHYQICYLCERQAEKALKFYKAATFAAAIDTIFGELIFQKKCRRNVFQKDRFKRMLDKFGLDNGKTTPGHWEAELKAIRRSTKYSRTQPLVVDHLGTYKKPPPTMTNEIFVIPDDPPLGGQVTSQYGGQVTSQYEGQVTSISCRAGGNICQIPGGSVANLKGQSRHSSTNVLISPPPQLPEETLIILDDEQDKDLDISIEKTVPSFMTPDPLLVPSTIHDPLIVATTSMSSQSMPGHTQALMTKNAQTAPRLVPLEKLLEKPKEIMTGDGLLLGTSDGNYSLHPIAIKEGITTIPSLQANVINNCCVVNTTQNAGNIYPIGEPPNNQMVENNSRLPINTIYCVTNPNQSKINYAAIVMSNVGDRKPVESVKRVIDDVATPCKKVKMLPVVKNNSVCDWEDKIPADVISTMSGVDPNRDPFIQPPPRLATQTQQYSSQVKPVLTNYTVTCDVVDLC